MNALTTSAIFVLLTIGTGAFAQSAFADHAEAIVDTPEGAIAPLGSCAQEGEDCFIPRDVTIDVGGEVTWINSDTVFHNVQSGTNVLGHDGLFGGPDLVMLPGDEYSFKFDDFEPGTYPYFCLVHPYMSGTVTVVATENGDGMMNGHEDGMMVTTIEDPSATGMLSDLTEIKIKATEPAEGERMEIMVEFVDSEHVNYDLMVTQNGETALEDVGAHEHQGMGTHTTAPLASSDPVDVTITFQGYGVDEITGPTNEEVAFTQIVPEFGTVAMIVLGVAIAGIVAATARSRVLPKI